MNQRDLKEKRRQQAMMARAARSARLKMAREQEASKPNGHLALDLERGDAHFLYEVLDGMGHETAAKIRKQLVAQVFSH